MGSTDKIAIKRGRLLSNFFHKEMQQEMVDSPESLNLPDVSAHSTRNDLQLMQDFFMQSPGAFCIMKGPEYIFTFANPSYRQLIGNRPLIGKSFREAFPEFEPYQYNKILDTISQTGQPFISKETLVRFDKGNGFPEDFYLDISCHAFKNETGTVEGILCFFYDVTQQVAIRKFTEESAEQVRTVLHSVPHMTWMADVSGNMIFENKWLHDYFTAGRYRYQSPGIQTRFIHPDDRKAYHATWQKHLAEQTSFEYEVRFRRASDKMYRWHLLQAQSIRDANGEFAGWVGTNSDVHDRKIFAEELESKVLARTQSLKRINMELERSNKNLQEFASIASHDLQEPLRKVQSFTILLQQEHSAELSGAARELVSKIEIASHRMSVLIKDVLQYSRLSHPHSGWESTNLDEIMTNVLLDFDMLCEEKRAVITKDKLPVIQAIPLQMNHLFYNIIGNALKFSDPARDPRINIQCRYLQPGEVDGIKNLYQSNAYCEISIHDNGIGFESEFSEQIFEIFQRLNNQSLYPGTGIGLALCRKIVFAHHGLIRAEGKEHTGASIYIVLPVKQKHEPRLPQYP